MTTWTLTRRGTTALATFDRPPRNLMSMAAMSELESLLHGVAGDESITVLVLTGGVPGYFVAHADLDDLSALGRGEPVEGDPGSWSRAFDLLSTMPQPVIAAVDGQAWGGGCELALACTIRVAADLGPLRPARGGGRDHPGRRRHPAPPPRGRAGRAAEMVLSGRMIDSAEAERIGLVQAVLPDDGFVDAALEWADRIAAHPRHAVVAAKQALVQGLARPLEDGLRLESRLFLECQARPEAVALEERAADRERAAPPDQRVDL